MRFVDPFSLPMERVTEGSGEIGLCGSFDPDEWVTVNVESHTGVNFSDNYGFKMRDLCQMEISSYSGDAGDETA